MYKLKIIFLLVLFFSKQYSHSQSLEFENFTTKNGLLSDDVYKIYQDKQGYIWLFTNYGAMKYNGNRFEQVLENLPFDESFIYSYYENSKGRKWVVNSNGKFFEVKGDLAVQIPGIEKLSSFLKSRIAEVTQLCVDENDNIYFNTKIGSYKLVKKENYKWYDLNTNNKDGKKKDTAIITLQEIDNTLFAGVSSFFNDFVYASYSPKAFKIEYKNTKNITKSFNFFLRNDFHVIPSNFITDKKVFYFSFINNAYKLDKLGTLTKLEVNSTVLQLCIDKKNRVWVATLNNGLLLFDEKGKLISHYFKGKTINHVLADSQDGLWVTTEGLGVFHCKNINEFHFDSNEPMGNSINFLKKIDDQIFIATSNGEIDIVKQNEQRFKKIFFPKNTFFFDIQKYGNDYILPSRFEFYLLKIGEKKTKISSKLTYFSSNGIYNFWGDTLWCLTRSAILILPNGLRDIQKELGSMQLSNKWMYFENKLFCLNIRNNEKIVGTNDGVFILKNKKLIRPEYFIPTQKVVITNIVKDFENNYWFCSKGNGIYKLTPSNQLINYDLLKNLPSNIVNNISINKSKEVLLSTNNGLFYSKTTELNKWIELYNGQVNSAEILNNKIYCGTKKGLVIINKDEEFVDKKIYFNLADISINKNKSTISDLQNLSHDKNNISFTFDAISFSRSFYDIKYQLVGPQNYSGISSDHQISFQKLSPGKYRLTAVLFDKNAAIDKIHVNFDIVPAFWQTLWFQVVIFLSFIFIVSLVVWLLFKRYKYRIDKKNEINRLIIEYKLIALKAQINPHFMSNCLTAIQHLILSNKVNEANKYLAKFSFLVRSVMQYSSKALVSLGEELQITRLNIELEQLRFENKFVFETNIDESIDLKEYCIPPLILQPIVENSIWHGLLPLKNKRIGKLQIGVEVFSDFLHVTITDNGVGRQIKKKDISNLRESKGIEITKQRITNLNNYYNFKKADLIYEDLLDENEEPAGTRVTIVLPIIKKDQSE